MRKNSFVKNIVKVVSFSMVFVFGSQGVALASNTSTASSYLANASELQLPQKQLTSWEDVQKSAVLKMPEQDTKILANILGSAVGNIVHHSTHDENDIEGFVLLYRYSDGKERASYKEKIFAKINADINKISPVQLLDFIEVLLNEKHDKVEEAVITDLYRRTIFSMKDRYAKVFRKDLKGRKGTYANRYAFYKVFAVLLPRAIHLAKGNEGFLKVLWDARALIVTHVKRCGKMLDYDDNIALVQNLFFTYRRNEDGVNERRLVFQTGGQFTDYHKFLLFVYKNIYTSNAFCHQNGEENAEAILGGNIVEGKRYRFLLRKDYDYSADFSAKDALSTNDYIVREILHGMDDLCRGYLKKCWKKIFAREDELKPIAEVKTPSRLMVEYEETVYEESNSLLSILSDGLFYNEYEKAVEKMDLLIKRDIGNTDTHGIMACRFYMPVAIVDHLLREMDKDTVDFVKMKDSLEKYNEYFSKKLEIVNKRLDSLAKGDVWNANREFHDIFTEEYSLRKDLMKDDLENVLLNAKRSFETAVNMSLVIEAKFAGCEGDEVVRGLKLAELFKKVKDRRNWSGSKYMILAARELSKSEYKNAKDLGIEILKYIANGLNSTEISEALYELLKAIKTNDIISDDEKDDMFKSIIEKLLSNYSDWHMIANLPYKKLKEILRMLLVSGNYTKTRNHILYKLWMVSQNEVKEPGTYLDKGVAKVIKNVAEVLLEAEPGILKEGAAGCLGKWWKNEPSLQIDLVRMHPVAAEQELGVDAVSVDRKVLGYVIKLKKLDELNLKEMDNAQDFIDREFDSALKDLEKILAVPLSKQRQEEIRHIQKYIETLFSCELTYHYQGSINGRGVHISFEDLLSSAQKSVIRTKIWELIEKYRESPARQRVYWDIYTSAETPFTARLKTSLMKDILAKEDGKYPIEVMRQCFETFLKGFVKSGAKDAAMYLNDKYREEVRFWPEEKQREFYKNVHLLHRTDKEGLADGFELPKGNLLRYIFDYNHGMDFNKILKYWDETVELIKREKRAFDKLIKTRKKSMGARKDALDRFRDELGQLSDVNTMLFWVLGGSDTSIATDCFRKISEGDPELYDLEYQQILNRYSSEFSNSRGINVPIEQAKVVLPIYLMIENCKRFEKIIKNVKFSKGGDLLPYLLRKRFASLTPKQQSHIISKVLQLKPEDLEDEGEILKEFIKMDGVLAIKLGQILSERPDLIGEEYVNKFRELQSGLDPLRFSDVLSVKDTIKNLLEQASEKNQKDESIKDIIESLEQLEAYISGQKFAWEIDAQVLNMAIRKLKAVEKLRLHREELNSLCRLVKDASSKQLIKYFYDKRGDEYTVKKKIKDLLEVLASLEFSLGNQTGGAISKKGLDSFNDGQYNWDSVVERLKENGWGVPVIGDDCFEVVGVRLMLDLTDDETVNRFERDFPGLLPILKKYQGDYHSQYALDRITAGAKILVAMGRIMKQLGGSTTIKFDRDGRIKELLGTAQQEILAAKEFPRAYVAENKLKTVTETYMSRLSSLDVVKDALAVKKRMIDEAFAEEGLTVIGDPIPKGTGSIAQAYEVKVKCIGEDRLEEKGLTADGDGNYTLVVKIRKPWIRSMILNKNKTESEQMLNWRRLANDLRMVRGRFHGMVDTVGLYDEFYNMLVEEIDFRNEARNYELLRFGHQSGIRYPVVVGASREDILIMEKIDGDDPIAACNRYGLNKARVGDKIMGEFFKAIASRKQMHGDWNPGNILVTKDGDVYMIDPAVVFSMEKGMPDGSKKDLLLPLIKLIFSIITRDSEGIFKTALEMNDSDSKPDNRKLRLGIERLLMDMVSGQKKSGLKEAEVIQELFRIMSNCGIVIDQSYMRFLRAFITVYGLARALNPKIDLKTLLMAHFSNEIETLCGGDIMSAGMKVMRATAMQGRTSFSGLESRLIKDEEIKHDEAEKEEYLSALSERERMEISDVLRENRLISGKEGIGLIRYILGATKRGRELLMAVDRNKVEVLQTDAGRTDLELLARSIQSGCGGLNLIVLGKEIRLKDAMRSFIQQAVAFEEKGEERSGIPKLAQEEIRGYASLWRISDEMLEWSADIGVNADAGLNAMRKQLVETGEKGLFDRLQQYIGKERYERLTINSAGYSQGENALSPNEVKVLRLILKTMAMGGSALEAVDLVVGFLSTQEFGKTFSGLMSKLSKIDPFQGYHFIRSSMRASFIITAKIKELLGKTNPILKDERFLSSVKKESSKTGPDAMFLLMMILESAGEIKDADNFKKTFIEMLKDIKKFNNEQEDQYLVVSYYLCKWQNDGFGATGMAGEIDGMNKDGNFRQDIRTALYDFANLYLSTHGQENAQGKIVTRLDIIVANIVAHVITMNIEGDTFFGCNELRVDMLKDIIYLSRIDEKEEGVGADSSLSFNKKYTIGTIRVFLPTVFHEQTHILLCENNYFPKTMTERAIHECMAELGACYGLVCANSYGGQIPELRKLWQAAKEKSDKFPQEHREGYGAVEDIFKHFEENLSGKDINQYFGVMLRIGLKIIREDKCDSMDEFKNKLLERIKKYIDDENLSSVSDAAHSIEETAAAV